MDFFSFIIGLMIGAAIVGIILIVKVAKLNRSLFLSIRACSNLVYVSSQHRQRIAELLDERDGPKKSRPHTDYLPESEQARYKAMAEGAWDNYGPGGMPY